MELVEKEVKEDIDQFLFSLNEVSISKVNQAKRDISIDLLIHKIYSDLQDISEVH